MRKLDTNLNEISRKQQKISQKRRNTNEYLQNPQKIKFIPTQIQFKNVSDGYGNSDNNG